MAYQGTSGTFQRQSLWFTVASLRLPMLHTQCLATCSVPASFLKGMNPWMWWARAMLATSVRNRLKNAILPEPETTGAQMAGD